MFVQRLALVGSTSKFRHWVIQLKIYMTINFGFEDQCAISSCVLDMVPAGCIGVSIYDSISGSRHPADFMAQNR